MKKFITFISTGLILVGIISAFSQSINVNNQLDYGNRKYDPFYESNTTVNNTNSLADVQLASVSIPGNTILSNGTVRVNILVDSDTSSATIKYFLIKLGGTIIKVFQINSTDRFNSFQFNLSNRNDPTKQITVPNSSTDFVFGAFSMLPATFSIDTTTSQTLSLSSSNTATGDSVNLRGLQVTIFPSNTSQ